MSQLILEKVARAISISNDSDPDWDNPPFWKHYIENAKAAIGALRDIPEDYFINKHAAFIWKDTIDRIGKDLATGK